MRRSATLFFLPLVVALFAAPGCDLIARYATSRSRDAAHDASSTGDVSATDAARRDLPPADTAAFDGSAPDGSATDGTAIDGTAADGSTSDLGLVVNDGGVLADVTAALKQTTTYNCNAAETRGGLAPFGVCTVDATVVNTSQWVLDDIHFVVTTLTNGNLLLNADGGPGGVNATLAVPATSLSTDGVLSRGESFVQRFEVGLKKSGSFTFYVQVLARPR